MENTEEKIREEAKERVAFKKHLKVYVAVNILTWAMWCLTSFKDGRTHGYWPIYSTLGWGFGVLMHYIGVYNKNESAVEREIEKIKKERDIS
ncbi:MAG: 2TM domain-containing protein [Flavobacteriales bacterium]|nr:2TM domain-containing protein [Flavobacteriales bacterium]